MTNILNDTSKFTNPCSFDDLDKTAIQEQCIQCSIQSALVLENPKGVQVIAVLTISTNGDRLNKWKINIYVLDAKGTKRGYIRNILAIAAPRRLSIDVLSIC